MKNYSRSLLFALFIIIFTFCIAGFSRPLFSDSNYLTYTVDPKQGNVHLFWKDDTGKIINTFPNLKQQTEKQGKQLIFAMNGGMYKTDYSPLGLYIENGKTLVAVNNANADGNFYLKPNGIFYINNSNVAGVCQTSEFSSVTNVKYATQSGPMLLINGKIHPEFKNGSTHVNIRNGVGILPDKKILFAMSKTPVNLYDFASYFKNQGCENALYLDGFVSRVYYPEENWIQNDGRFGVMIGVTK